MSEQTVLLGTDDWVFLLGDKAYALVPTKAGWKAAEVYRRDDGYFRADAFADIDDATVRGVVCQQEFFAAAKLPSYFNRDTFRTAAAHFDEAARDVDEATRRVRHSLRKFGTH